MGKMMKVFEKVRHFFEHTSLHGFRFIAERERHWSERFLWLFLCATSWIGCGILFQTSYTAFKENAIRFGVETTYLDQNTPYPSVSVCEYENFNTIYERANELFGEGHDINLDDVLRELTYFKGSIYYMKEFCNEGGTDCPKGNFSELVQKVRASCEQIFIECLWYPNSFHWNDTQDIECCKHFVPIETELGTCFSFSEQNEKKLKDQGEPDWLDTTANVHKPLPELRITMNTSALVYLHSDYEVPNWNSKPSLILRPEVGELKSYYITTTDTENPPEVRDLSVYQRKCRFPDENDLKTADFYSFSACVVDCRHKAQIERCNCTSHLTPKTKPDEHCDYDGLICLDRYYSHFSKPKPKWSNRDGLACDCLPSCADTDFDVSYIKLKDNASDLVTTSSYISIKLVRLSTERYKRNVVKGIVVLVASMGSTAGLFLGASLLSLVEVVNFILFRVRTREQLLDIATITPEENETTLNENDSETPGAPLCVQSDST